jgi:hypothetical protein
LVEIGGHEKLTLKNTHKSYLPYIHHKNYDKVCSQEVIL